MHIARSTCALLTIWLQRMFENGNIILVYSPLLDRLGLGPRLVGRLGFRSTG